MAEEKDTKMRIAAVGDLHVSVNDKGKWTGYFRQVSKVADVLLICGDLTDTGDEAEAEILSEELKNCSIPVVAVLGNHDFEKGRHKLIRKILANDQVHILEGESVIIGDIGFAGVKGFGGGFDTHMVTMFGEDAMKAFVREAMGEAMQLDRALARIDAHHGIEKKVVLLHYAPVSDTVRGEPEPLFPFLGCTYLAEPLNRRNVQAAFHGHAHLGTLHGKTSAGVDVFNVSVPILVKEGFTEPFFIFEISTR